MALTYSVNLGALNRVRNDLSLKTRRRIFDFFMRECAPGPDSLVADFGVSGHQDHPVHYFFETLYPYRNNLTVIARASEHASWFPDRFPGVQLLEADLREIPLPDLHFDSGICNAVIEHAGDRAQQRALVQEVCRVCRCVLFTTPNKAFPIELHTFLPVLHWLPDRTYRRVLKRIGLSYFADVNNLNLLDAKTLLSLFPPSRRTAVSQLGSPLLPTNILCVSRAPGM
jgi:hypothetical protein